MFSAGQVVGRRIGALSKQCLRDTKRFLAPSYESTISGLSLARPSVRRQICAAPIQARSFSVTSSITKAFVASPTCKQDTGKADSSAASNSSGSTDDFRPASSRIFSPSEIESAIEHLTSLGYDASTIWEQRVVWGDHDQFGHVNNVHYVRWFESSRMFFSQGITNLPHFTEQRRNEVLRGTGQSFILANIDVRYRRPVVYPDTILIAQAVELPLQQNRFNLKAVAYSLAQKTIVAISNQDCVTYDYTKLKKCDIPEDIRIGLEQKGTDFSQKK